MSATDVVAVATECNVPHRDVVVGSNGSDLFGLDRRVVDLRLRNVRLAERSRPGLRGRSHRLGLKKKHISATRYDKLGATFFAFIKIAAVQTWLRSI